MTNCSGSRRLRRCSRVPVGSVAVPAWSRSQRSLKIDPGWFRTHETPGGQIRIRRHEARGVRVLRRDRVVHRDHGPRSAGEGRHLSERSATASGAARSPPTPARPPTRAARRRGRCVPKALLLATAARRWEFAPASISPTCATTCGRSARVGDEWVLHDYNTDGDTYMEGAARHGVRPRGMRTDRRRRRCLRRCAGTATICSACRPRAGTGGRVHRCRAKLSPSCSWWRHGKRHGARQPVSQSGFSA